MVGLSLGPPANADAAISRGSSSKPGLVRAIFRKAAHLYPARFVCDLIIEGLGCESAASGSLRQSLLVEFPSPGSYGRAPATDARGTMRPRGRRQRRPARDRLSIRGRSLPFAASVVWKRRRNPRPSLSLRVANNCVMEPVLVPLQAAPRHALRRASEQFVRSAR